MSMHNKLSCHMSIITCHTVILTLQVSRQSNNSQISLGSMVCLSLENSRWWLGTSLGRKAGFPSRCPSGPLLLICTVWMTLLLDAQTTRIIRSIFPSHYLQNFQISQFCLSTTILLCLVHVYTCYTMM